jgi:hypothetical protein
MSLSTYDDFLDAIAHQAREAYATQQLHACETAFDRWLAQAALELGQSERPHMRRNLAYYAQQTQRWQDYLDHLEKYHHATESAPAFRMPEVSEMEEL